MLLHGRFSFRFFKNDFLISLVETDSFFMDYFMVF